MPNIFLLFNIGGGELFFLVLIVIMFFGADKIPEIARGLAKGMKMVRNATDDLKREIVDSADESGDFKEMKDTIAEGKKQVEEITGSIKRNTRI